MAYSNGRIALVTGASGGIGRAIATGLAAHGANLCVVGRDADRLAETVRILRKQGASVLPSVADLTRRDDVESLTELIGRGLGGLDILVHAAGVYTSGPLAVSDIDDLEAQYQANIRAPYRLIRSLLPLLVHRNGDIVFVNSTQGQSTAGGTGLYAASQHATKAIADSLRAEVNPDGVRVIMLHVGRTATPLQERIFAAEGRPYTPEVLIQPADLADLVVTALELPKRTQVANLTIWPTRKV